MLSVTTYYIAGSSLSPNRHDSGEQESNLLVDTSPPEKTHPASSQITQQSRGEVLDLCFLCRVVVHQSTCYLARLDSVFVRGGLMLHPQMTRVLKDTLSSLGNSRVTHDSLRSTSTVCLSMVILGFTLSLHDGGSRPDPRHIHKLSHAKSSCLGSSRVARDHRPTPHPSISGERPLLIPKFCRAQLA